MKLRSFAYFCLGTILSSYQVTNAARTYGRFSVGGYASTERFKDSSTQPSQNDKQILSARSYLKTEDLYTERWELVADFRDKHDFFYKLSNDRQTLVGENDLQTRQLSVRNAAAINKMHFQMGRFPVLEAGSTYVDGGHANYLINDFFRSGFFAGFNPHKEALSYLQFDKEANIAGLNVTYENKNGGWERNQYLSHAIVVETLKSKTDRLYLFHNGIYQWSYDSRFISFMYFDFSPRAKLQSGNVNWQDKLGPKISFDVQALYVDVIEYIKRRSVLESLPSSAYKEVGASGYYRLTDDGSMILKATTGAREADNLSRSTFLAGYNQTHLISRFLFGKILIGNRKNFTSNDTLAQTSLGYFRKSFEINVNVEYANQKNDDGSNTHPLTTELDFAYFNREFFAAFEVQRATDERVTIDSALVKIGYRYGNKEPLQPRDGAPPRGVL